MCLFTQGQNNIQETLTTYTKHTVNNFVWSKLKCSF